jgi:hypothetical protein
MADFTDNYAIVGGASDYFNCESTSGWSTGGVATSFQTGTEHVQGTYSLELQSSGSGTANWYHDLSLGYRFKITEKDLHFWFKYVKGKGANFLVQDGTAVVIRLYFGGTTIYADYRCTESGDLELNFGWQVLSCSGNNLRGGSTGGGHNDGSDWELDINRIELILNFANSTDTPLNMDCWFAGNSITITNGDETSPCLLSDIVTYSNNTRSDFPLGIVNLKGALFDIKSGLIIGDGLSGIGHQGYLVADSTFIYLHPLSKYVSHNLTINEYSTFISGKKETDSSNNYYVSGNIIVTNLYDNDYGSNIYMETSSYCYLYDTKLYNFSQITLGSLSTPSTTVDLYDVDIDTFKKLYLYSDSVSLNSVDIHDDVATSYDPTNGFVISSSPILSENINIYRCYVGITFVYSDIISNCTITDITDSHISIHDTYSPILIDSIFDTTKLRRYV